MENKDCIFCKIANGELHANTLYEDQDFRVILDVNPATKGHALILPKKHGTDLCDLEDEIGAKVLPLAKKIGIAMKQGLGCAGFHLIQNNGKAAGQTVFHFHMHVIPRYEDEESIVMWMPKEGNTTELKEILKKVKEVLTIG